MRSYVVFVVLVVLLSLMGVLLATRGQSPPSLAEQALDGEAKEASLAAGVDAGQRRKAPRAMNRPLRVTALGWDLLAPGVSGNGGTLEGCAESEFAAVGLEVHLAASDGIASLEGRLARGGADPDGADLAILPLPVYVAMYERLHALESRNRPRRGVVARTRRHRGTGERPPRPGPPQAVHRGSDPRELGRRRIDDAGVVRARLRRDARQPRATRQGFGRGRKARAGPRGRSGSDGRRRQSRQPVSPDDRRRVEADPPRERRPASPRRIAAPCARSVGPRVDRAR